MEKVCSILTTHGNLEGARDNLTCELEKSQIVLKTESKFSSDAEVTEVVFSLGLGLPSAVFPPIEEGHKDVNPLGGSKEYLQKLHIEHTVQVNTAKCLVAIPS